MPLEYQRGLPLANYGRVSTVDMGQDVENQLPELRRFVGRKQGRLCGVSATQGQSRILAGRLHGRATANHTPARRHRVYTERRFQRQ